MRLLIPDPPYEHERGVHPLAWPTETLGVTGVAECSPNKEIQAISLTQILEMRTSFAQTLL